MSAKQIQDILKKNSNPERAKASLRYFKTGSGQYGEGDRFHGNTVPFLRQTARRFKDLPREELTHLLHSPMHEERLTALLILATQFKKADTVVRKDIVDYYLANTTHINNWDLVDTSARDILGSWLQGKDTRLLKKLARSPSQWERRIAVISTGAFLKAGDPKPTIEIAAMLLKDKEDLIHKATGWMLREMGKYCSLEDLNTFLVQHAAHMPRTALRYAIEHLPENERRYWMSQTTNRPS